MVLGEIVRIAEDVKPEAMRLIWWDDGIYGEQYFKQENFDSMKDSLAPHGGGGTRLSCVAEYIREKEYKPKAVIIITDGYIESQYELPEAPVLFGVVDNERFVPLRGKVIHLNSTNL